MRPKFIEIEAKSILTKHKFPVHIGTKSNLVLTDIDLLKEIAKETWCTVSFLWAAWAYHKASQAIENLNENIRGICKRRELRRITGVGDNMAKVIEEFLVSRRTESLEKMINTW